MRTATALLTILLLATSAVAQESTHTKKPPLIGPVPHPPGLRLVPPKEYDHPYNGPGQLYITYAESQDEVRRLCPNAPFPKAGAYGCSMTSPTKGCWVILAPEEDMKKVGVWMDLIRRHEIAHCNGWPGDHRGALPIEDWAEMQDTVPSIPATPAKPRPYIQR